MVFSQYETAVIFSLIGRKEDVFIQEYVLLLHARFIFDDVGYEVAHDSLLDQTFIY